MVPARRCVPGAVSSSVRGGLHLCGQSAHGRTRGAGCHVLTQTGDPLPQKAWARALAARPLGTNPFPSFVGFCEGSAPSPLPSPSPRVSSHGQGPSLAVHEPTSHLMRPFPPWGGPRVPMRKPVPGGETLTGAGASGQQGLRRQRPACRPPCAHPAPTLAWRTPESGQSACDSPWRRKDAGCGRLHGLWEAGGLNRCPPAGRGRKRARPRPRRPPLSAISVNSAFYARR